MMTAKSTCRAICLAALSLMMGVAAPERVEAQGVDCGSYCGPCLVLYWEGRTNNSQGHYNMNCTMSGECNQTGCPIVELASEVPVAAEAIFEEIDGLPDSEIAGAIQRYQDRILIQVSRNLLLIRGTACNPDVITAVKFVTPTVTKALQAGGAVSLERFLEELGDSATG